MLGRSSAMKRDQLCDGTRATIVHQRIDERGLAPGLPKTAGFLSTRRACQFADRIMGDCVPPTDACRQVRRRIVVRLVEDIERLPAERLSALVGWVFANDPAVEQPSGGKSPRASVPLGGEPDPRIKSHWRRAAANLSHG